MFYNDVTKMAVERERVTACNCLEAVVSLSYFHLLLEIV